MATASAAWSERPTQYSWRRSVPRTAGLARRGAALLLDGLVIVMLTYVLTFSLAAAGLLQLPRVSLTGGLGDTNLGFLWLATLLELPVNLAYFTLLEGHRGRTLGKAIVGLRVVTVAGRPITFFDAFLRSLLRLLWMTPVGLAFVFLDAWFVHNTEMEQRIGDLAAGTLVVMDEPVPG